MHAENGKICSFSVYKKIPAFMEKIIGKQVNINFFEKLKMQ